MSRFPCSILLRSERRILTVNFNRVVILAAYRLLSLRSLRASSNLSFDRMPLVAWTQVELAYSLITATIPCLMVFMGMLNTACGTLSPETVIARSQQESQKITGGSYELQTYQRSSRLRSQDHVGGCPCQSEMRKQNSG